MFSMIRVNWSVSTGQSEVYQTGTIDPYSTSGGHTWTVSVGYYGFSADYSWSSNSSGYSSNGSSWSNYADGSWPTANEVYSSDSASNGISAEAQVVASDEQPTGTYTGHASVDVEYYDSTTFSSWWIDNDNAPWYYTVVS